MFNFLKRRQTSEAPENTAPEGTAPEETAPAGKAQSAEAAGPGEETAQTPASQEKAAEAEAVREEREAGAAPQTWPKIPPLNRISITGKKLSLPEDFPEERKAELGGIALEKTIAEESLKPLSLEELLFVTTVFAMHHAGQKTLEEREEQNSRTLHNELLDRVRGAGKFYCLYEKSTGYPLLDDGFVLLYLDRGHAEKAAELYRAQYRNPDVREFTDVNDFFNRLYFLGMERVLVDNGFYKGILGRGEMTAPPDALLQEGQTIQAAPRLCLAMVDVLQEVHWPVKYEKREEILRAKVSRMTQLAAATRFLLPVDVKKPEGHAAEGAADSEKVIPMQQGMQIRAPLLSVSRRLPPKEQGGEPQTVMEKMIPLYTDFYEYRKNMAPKEKLRPLAVQFRQIGPFLAQASGVILNAEGERITIRREKIEELLGGAAQGKPAGPAAAH